MPNLMTKSRSSKIRLVKALKAKRIRLCRGSLAEFVRAAWVVIEPATPLIWGKHLDAICLHLEAVARGDIRNLVISIPPNTAKSILTSVLFPAWCWARSPETRFLCAANEDALVVRDSVRCRYVLESDWYKEYFPHVRLTSDQNEKWHYQNTRLGFRQCVTVGGAVTGKKGDILIVDDPHDARKVFSKADRAGVKLWWRNAFYNRVSDARTGRRVVIAQRTHDDDLSGYLLRDASFMELRLPEEYNPNKSCETAIGWKDWRTEPNELLRSALFGPEQVVEAKSTLGPSGYGAQHLQDPVVDGGAHFKVDKLRRYEWRGEFICLLPVGDVVAGTAPKLFKPFERRRFCTIDPAASASNIADFTVISTWCVSPWGDLIWLACERFKVEIPYIVPRIQKTVLKWRPAFVGIEAVLSNRAVHQLATDAQNPSIPAHALDPGGRDKLVRAGTAITLVETGRVYLPTAQADPTFPNDIVIDELARFTGMPNADSKDDVADTIAYAGEHMTTKNNGDQRPGMPKVIGG